MPRTRPPFRADHVGSLLRTPPVVEARARREAGEISAEQLREVEDAEIVGVIARQEEIGMQLATDGEFRRAFWHFDFYSMLDGCELYELDHGIQFQGVQTKPKSIRVTGPIGFPADHPMLGHFRFLREHTRVMPKMTIPSPTVLHFRLEPGAVDTRFYDNREAIFDDLVTTYRDAVRAFHDAGCRYLQFDDTAWAYLCSEKEMQKAAERGLDTDRIIADYADILTRVLADKPADMTITTHVCRGNFRSTWIAEGGYDPVAEALLGGVPYDGFFLEYDSDRAGDFSPLRHLPRGEQIAVVGVVTSKSGELEPKDDIKRRLDEASKYVPYEQMALSTQCGFASTEEGNVLTQDQQWAKLEMIREIAEEVWG